MDSEKQDSFTVLNMFRQAVDNTSVKVTCLRRRMYRVTMAVSDIFPGILTHFLLTHT